MMRWSAALTILATAAGLAPAEVKTETVAYEYDGTKLKGYLAYDAGTADKRPGVLVVHEWWGLNEYAKERCRKLAELGFVAFAPDMYGEGQVTTHPADAMKFATTVRNNVKTWRGRADAGLKVLASQPTVDSGKLAAIGYCFGGSTCLQLAYAGRRSRPSPPSTPPCRPRRPRKPRRSRPESSCATARRTSSSPRRRSRTSGPPWTRRA